MYILENTKLKKIIAGLGLATSILLLSGCGADKSEITKIAVDGGVKYETKNGKYTSYHVNTQETKDFKYGRTPTKREIKAWDIDLKT